MAKKVAEKAVKAVAGAMVTIKDLCAEFEIEAKDLRALLRANGFKAPEIAREPGVFGPKAKYEWAEGSPEIKKIRALIESTVEADPVADPKVAAKTKANKAKAEPEVESDDDAEDEDEADEEPAPKAKAKAGKKK